MFSGCSNKSNPDNLITTVTPSPIGVVLVTVTPEPTKVTNYNESEATSTPQPDNYMEMGLKEDWEYIEQTGIDESASINAQINTGFDDCDALPICYCEAYDVLYYINYYDNEFIYRYKDDEIKPAVKITADNLYMRSGELYFMVKGEYDGLIGVKEGDICKYSPITGEIKLLIADMDAEWMTVSDEGIYYRVLDAKIPNNKGGYTLEYSMYYYDFDEEVSEEAIISPRFVLWKDDSLIEYHSEKQENGEYAIGLGIHKIGSSFLDDKPLIFGNYYSYCIQGDILYCDDADYFNVVQLDTGEIKKYKKINAHGFAFGGMGAFTVNDNKAYQRHLVFYIDLETGIVHNLSGEGGKYVTKLFNVNNKVYALYYEKGYHSTNPTGTPELMEVVFDDETFTNRNGEFLGYKFVSIGEE